LAAWGDIVPVKAPASRAATVWETSSIEEFAGVNPAIQREKSLKRYLRQWKISLIETSNPQWVDLYPGLLARHG
jgi:predicted GIY-YIG superfamily endonuclease